MQYIDITWSNKEFSQKFIVSLFSHVDAMEAIVDGCGGPPGIDKKSPPSPCPGYQSAYKEW